MLNENLCYWYLFFNEASRAQLATQQEKVLCDKKTRYYVYSSMGLLVVWYLQYLDL